jgi:hypothetical protein
VKGLSDDGCQQYNGRSCSRWREPAASGKAARNANAREGKEKPRKGLHPAARLPNDAPASDEAAAAIVGRWWFPTPSSELKGRGAAAGDGRPNPDCYGIPEGRPDPVGCNVWNEAKR